MPYSLRPLAILVAGVALFACSETDTGSEAETAAPASDVVADDSWTHPVTPWGDPDLQGMWPIYHLISTPLQRPERFGERLHFNEEEIAQQRAALEARNQRYAEENANDRMGMGHWAEESELPTQTSLIVDPPNGRLPEMTEEGKRLAERMASSWTEENFDSVDDFDTWDRCITRGLPPSMFPFNYNNGIEIVQAPGYVVINMEMIHEARIVPVDGRPPLASDIKQWLGESRGHWEGNTLVVETTNFNGLGGMINFGTPGTPRANMPTTTDMRIVERFERVGNERINYSITTEDPNVLTRPWTAAFPWKLDPDYEFFEYACNEDNYAIRDFIVTSRYRRAQEAGAGEE